MKKILFSILVILFVVSGCSNVNSSKDSIKMADIKGYWLQVERNWSGDVTDLTNNRYAYLEVTNDNLFFYSTSSDEDEGYSVAEKYYKLELNKLYYDYYELKGTNWKKDMNEAYGGIFNVSFNGKKLVLTEYDNEVDESDGYEKNTYIRADTKDWPIEE